MADINNYANDLLLDFCDAVHAELKRTLQNHFGEDWVEQGVRRHFRPDYFDRIREMLNSPMRSVDMARSEDELYGIEHMWNIVNGNWNLFQDSFGKSNKNRTETYLGEITELRNNLAHRRKRHVLLRRDLVRILGNCQAILSALQSPRADTFTDIVDTLSAGTVPWGAPLHGHLPPSDEMYAEFVGRPDELAELSGWLASDSPQILVWGYGGSGKSSLAHKFAHDVIDSSNDDLIAVCWVSAKRSEYLEGTVRDRPADFSDLESFIRALWWALYGPAEVPNGLDAELILKDLQEFPILLIVDDFDTISEDVELAEFLLFKLRMTSAKVIYTSRQRVQGIRNLEMLPFSDEELSAFVKRQSLDYQLDQTESMKRLQAIRSVTDGYPLFVDDLIRHASLVGIDEAIDHWGQKKGDKARQYALQRQTEYLSRSSGEVLIALAVANRALKLVEISNIAGLTDDDAEAGVRDLLRWRMVNQVRDDDSDSSGFRMNRNTSRLVQQTFRDDGRMRSFEAAFRSLSGERVPEARRAAIARVVRQTNDLVRSGAFGQAERNLLDSMTGELADSADLYGVLGWVYSCQSPPERFATLAEEVFDTAHRLGSTKDDTYYHWAEFERKLAESMFDLDSPKEKIADQWKKCEEVAKIGVERCGPSQRLCYMAGYGAAREAKARELANNFTYAQGCYTRAIDWLSRALTAPVSDETTVAKGAIFRGLTLAHEGLGDEEQVRQTLKLWYVTCGSEWSFEKECGRLLRKYLSLQSVPEFQYLLQQMPFIV